MLAVELIEKAEVLCSFVTLIRKCTTKRKPKWTFRYLKTDQFFWTLTQSNGRGYCLVYWAVVERWKTEGLAVRLSRSDETFRIKTLRYFGLTICRPVSWKRLSLFCFTICLFYNSFVWVTDRLIHWLNTWRSRQVISADRWAWLVSKWGNIILYLHCIRALARFALHSSLLKHCKIIQNWTHMQNVCQVRIEFQSSAKNLPCLRGSQGR